MNKETFTKHNHTNVNANLMEENAIQINGGITTNVNVNFKIVFNPASCSCKNGNYLACIMED